jgi:hypothetical protein
MSKDLPQPVQYLFSRTVQGFWYQLKIQNYYVIKFLVPHLRYLDSVPLPDKFIQIGKYGASIDLNAPVSTEPKCIDRFKPKSSGLL